MRIAVVRDGTRPPNGRPDVSSQDEVTKDITSALRKTNRAVRVFPCEENISLFIDSLKKFKPDCVFNLAESIFGDARNEYIMPLILKSAGLRFTGADSAALALAGDKIISKNILKTNKIPVPEFTSGITPGFPLPAILKPSREHASIGISENSIAETEDRLKEAAERIKKKFRQPPIIEKFIEGREISVSVIGNDELICFPPAEIIFTRGERIVSYSAKWRMESREYKNTTPECPAKLDKKTGDKIKNTAVLASKAHSAEGYARVDFRLDKDQNPFVIDFNPNPDPGKASGLALAARAAGLSYEDLLGKIISLALTRG